MDWFELNCNSVLNLRPEFVFLIFRTLKCYHTFNSFDCSIGISGLSIRFKSGQTKIRVVTLKKVLRELKIPFYKASSNISSLGRNDSIRNTRFPFIIRPLWGALLAHSFFDGYADEFTLRYSNYDLDIRKEFVNLTKEARISGVNCPDNFRNDINVSGTVSRMLKVIFNVNSFYSKECRLSERFFNIVKKCNLFGWYFLKGAFLDEGSLTSGQIWIVRGITNRSLAFDLVRLCGMLGLKTRIQETYKDYAYSVGLHHQSFVLFYLYVNRLTKYKGKKMLKLKKRIRIHVLKKKHQAKISSDFRLILNYLATHSSISTSEISKLCRVSDLPALLRAKLLLKNRNIKNVGVGKFSRYILISRKALMPKLNLNLVRRELGWR